MGWLRGLRDRLGFLFQKERFESELAEELQFHLEQETEKNLQAGMSPGEAMRAARRAFGAVEKVKEEVREETGVRPLEDLVLDVRYAVRTLRRSPGFTTVAILTLALGIGANTAIFTVIDHVMLRPLVYDTPDRLVLLWNRTAHTGPERIPIAAPDVAVYREQARLFEGFAFTNRVSDAALTDDGEPQHIKVGGVTPNFFSLLGVPPGLGRDFDADEDLIPPEMLQDSTAIIPPPALIISNGLWVRRFGGDPDVVGRTLYVNGQPATIVGVTREGFELLIPPDVGIAAGVDVWAPIRVDLSNFRRADGLRDQDSDNTGAVIARLKPGATLADAQAEMDAISVGLRRQISSYERAGIGITVEPMHAAAVEHIRPTLLALWAAVGLVLLIACINVANLLLVRAMSRRKELALRSALGATRLRIARQILTESALLALAGGAAGTILAKLGIDLFMVVRPVSLPLVDNIAIDSRVLAFSLGATVLAALLFGLLPAFDSALMKSGSLLKQRVGDAYTTRSRRLRGGLVAAEVAVSLVLLISAGLMLRSFVSLNQIRPGFDPERVLAFNISLRYADRYQGPAARAQFVHQLEGRINALPGVEAVGLVGRLPLAGRIWTQPYGLEGQSEAEWAANAADFRMITSGYFRAMGTKLMAGRFFTEDEDLFENRRVVIIDEKMARRIAPGGAPVGKRLGFPLDGKPIGAEVVGVVEHVRHESLSEDGRETVYVPYRQEASRDVALVVRTSGEPGGLVEPIRNEVKKLAPHMPIYNVITMKDYIGAAVAQTRFSLSLIALFGALALALASVGLYGVISYSVRQRTRDLGIRMALGARGETLVRQIVVSGLTLASIGIAAGLAFSLLVSRAMTSLLFGVEATDPVTLAAISSLLLAVATVACYLPARQASRVDPMEALRTE